jgi:hypothetical protein
MHVVTDAVLTYIKVLNRRGWNGILFVSGNFF